MTTFKASVQYGDWKGTAAADNGDFATLDKYLDENGLKQEGEFLIATSLWVGENNGKNLGSVYARAFLYSGDASFDTVKAALDAQSGTVPVRVVVLEMTIEQYIGLFKRFDVMLTRPGLNIEGRDYDRQD